MAKRRMMSMQIVDSDAFLDMPSSAQNLYFHLLARADDEGFSNNYKKIMRIVKAAEDDLKILMAKNFIIIFETGVLVIKHWLIHNTMRKDRITPTSHTEERQQIFIKENGSYTLKNNVVNQMSTNCQPNVGLDKISIDKISIEELEDKSSLFVETNPEITKSQKIDFESITDYWNTHSFLKEITKITDQRKPNVNARVKEFGINAIYKMIDNVGRSSFLRGDNSRGFMATFDWCFKPKNFPKVLEGNYLDGEKETFTTDVDKRSQKLRERTGSIS